ncbi:MAG: hypothetical protein R3246_02730 [Acidimicrobiia bacterium]|nr:hypothetical protein [Acidimicrobiia bacterium]
MGEIPTAQHGRTGREGAAPLHLAPGQVVEDRLFAHPDHVNSDRVTLCLLIRDVHRRLRDATGPLEVWDPSPESWYRHVIIPRPEAFARMTRLTVVGFFGRKRDVVPIDVARQIQNLSAELDRKISEFPSVLSYSTHLLVDENNYANLVLLDSTDAISAWRSIAPHPVAAGLVSKQYYAFVRIYHGQVDTASMGREGAVELHRVKYWDYRSDPTWTAHRELVAG